MRETKPFFYEPEISVGIAVTTMASGASNTQDVARLEDTRPTCSEHRQKPDIPSTGMTVLSSGGHDPVAE